MSVRMLADLGPVEYETEEQVAEMLRTWTGLSSAKFLAFEDSNGSLVGYTAILKINLRDRNAEFGIIVGKDHWGKVFTIDMVRVTLEYVFDELGLHRIYAHIHAENERSLRLAGKLGFQDEGVLRGMIYRQGRFQDVKMLSLLRPEYDKLRTRLFRTENPQPCP